MRQYKYLGVLFCLNGSFTNALTDLNRKAFFKVCSIFSSSSVKIDQFIHIFDHIIKPVLHVLYSSEVLGMFTHDHRIANYRSNITSSIYVRSPLEKVNVNLCKYTLSVSEENTSLGFVWKIGVIPSLYCCS